MTFIKGGGRGGFVTGAEIVSFIVINALMFAAFSLGSSIRFTQDAKIRKAMEEEKARQDVIDAARKKAQQQKQGQASKRPEDDKKSGVIEIGAGRRQQTPSINVSAQSHSFKKLPPALQKKQPGSDTKQAPPVQQGKTKPGQQQSAARKNPAPPKNTGENNLKKPDASGFTDRFASLFNPFDPDPFGADLYDEKAASDSREIAILRLINRVNLDRGDDDASGEIFLAADSSGVEITADSSAEIYLASEGDGDHRRMRGTGEGELKQQELISKFIYAYKDRFFIGTNAGLYFVKKDDIPEYTKVTQKTVFKFERCLPSELPPAETVSMAGNGGDTLFWGTGSTIYRIDLEGMKAEDIGAEELLEDSNWYSLCCYKNTLYLANYKKIFKFAADEKKWYFSLPYSEFTDAGICEVINFVAYEDLKLNLCFMMITSNVGVVCGKMPSFDPDAGEYRENAKKIRTIRKLFNRDLTLSRPGLAYGDDNSVWISFDSNDTLSCELIRFDKKTERYERYNQSDKLKTIYAIDLASYDRNIIFGTNGDDVYAILRIRNVEKNFWVYSFWPIGRVPGVFSLAVIDQGVVCATTDGKAVRIDASDIIKSLEK